jgi:hypothetical protein
MTINFVLIKVTKFIVFKKAIIDIPEIKEPKYDRTEQTIKISITK